MAKDQYCEHGRNDGMCIWCKLLAWDANPEDVIHAGDLAESVRMILSHFNEVHEEIEEVKSRTKPNYDPMWE